MDKKSISVGDTVIFIDHQPPTLDGLGVRGHEIGRLGEVIEIVPGGLVYQAKVKWHRIGYHEFEDTLEVGCTLEKYDPFNNLHKAIVKLQKLHNEYTQEGFTANDVGRLRGYYDCNQLPERFIAEADKKEEAV